MAGHLITVFVSSPDTYSERRFPSYLSVGDLKAKLVSITGIPATSQRLALQPPSGRPGVLLSNDSSPLSDYGLSEGATIDVVDTDPVTAAQRGQFSDVSQVDKFELADEEYAKRNDSVLAFKQRNRLGRFAQTDGPPATSEDALPPGLEVGKRCEVASLSDAAATDPPRGVVRFVGDVVFGKGGVWVGIEYDEPVGKNDGSVEGRRYFDAKPGFGAFVKPDRVSVGDFPERDPFAEDGNGLEEM